MKNLIVIISLVFVCSISANDIKDTCEEIIKKEFGSSVQFDFKEFHISDSDRNKIESQTGQKFFSDRVVIWEIVENDSLNAIGLLDNVYGKSMPITFMVIYDLSAKVIRADIVKYREAYGGGVSNKNWLEQFTGLNSQSTYKLGEEISSISGATISSRSVTRGINKLSLLAEIIIGEYEYKTLSTR